jgi:hypothetical protein
MIDGISFEPSKMPGIHQSFFFVENCPDANLEMTLQCWALGIHANTVPPDATAFQTLLKQPTAYEDVA